MRVAAAVLVGVLLVAGCSRAAPDPNVSACQAWSVAYKAVTDAGDAYSGSGYDPKFDAAIKTERAVLASGAAKTTGTVQQSMRDVLAAYEANDGAKIGTAEYVLGLACSQKAR